MPIFLVISQRAKPSGTYQLNNLPGHGRIDIIFRCILSASRKILQMKPSKILVFMKGDNPTGWLQINPEIVDENDDEISLAAKVKENWNQLFQVGDLDQLLDSLHFSEILLLAEDGDEFEKHQIMEDSLVVLGAQNDLTENDVASLGEFTKITLGNISLLASQAIIYLRQLIYTKNSEK